MYYEFEKPDKITTGAKIVNFACKLLYEKHNGDIKAACKEGAKFFKYCSNYDDYLAEFIYEEIPLMAYNDLLNDKYPYFEDEDGEELDLKVEDVLEEIALVCKQYYN